MHKYDTLLYICLYGEWWNQVYASLSFSIYSKSRRVQSRKYVMCTHQLQFKPETPQSK